MAEPKGWSFDKRRKVRPYKAQINVNGVIEFLGYWDTPEEAHAAYMKARERNPYARKSGGPIPGTYTPPRVICKNCKQPVAKPRFNFHFEACTRNYPDGRLAWSPPPPRKKRQYIKKGDRKHE